MAGSFANVMGTGYSGNMFGGINIPGQKQTGRKFWNEYQPTNNYASILANLNKGLGSLGPTADANGNYSWNIGTTPISPDNAMYRSWQNDLTQQNLGALRNDWQNTKNQMAGLGIARGARGLGVRQRGGGDFANMQLTHARSALGANQNVEQQSYDRARQYYSDLDASNRAKLTAYQNLLGMQKGIADQQTSADQWLAGQRGNEYNQNWDFAMNLPNLMQQREAAANQRRDEIINNQAAFDRNQMARNLYLGFPASGGASARPQPQGLRQFNYLNYGG